jgi:hypothetical protein
MGSANQIDYSVIAIYGLLMVIVGLYVTAAQRNTFAAEAESHGWLPV